DGEILQEVARQFRLREPRRDEFVFGYVRELHRSEDESYGRVRIRALVDGRARSLMTELSPSDYDVAVEAHQRQLPLALLGDLEFEGQRWRLLEPRDIRIIEDEDEE